MFLFFFFNIIACCRDNNHCNSTIVFFFKQEHLLHSARDMFVRIKIIKCLKCHTWINVHRFSVLLVYFCTVPTSYLHKQNIYRSMMIILRYTNSRIVACKIINLNADVPYTLVLDLYTFRVLHCLHHSRV